MYGLKYFLNPLDTDMLTQLSLRLKEELSQTPSFARREKVEGDSLWTDLARSWYGALITSEDVRMMNQRRFPSQESEKVDT